MKSANGISRKCREFSQTAVYLQLTHQKKMIFSAFRSVTMFMIQKLIGFGLKRVFLTCLNSDLGAHSFIMSPYKVTCRLKTHRRLWNAQTSLLYVHRIALPGRRAISHRCWFASRTIRALHAESLPILIFTFTHNSVVLYWVLLGFAWKGLKSQFPSEKRSRSAVPIGGHVAFRWNLICTEKFSKSVLSVASDLSYIHSVGLKLFLVESISWAHSSISYYYVDGWFFILFVFTITIIFCAYIHIYILKIEACMSVKDRKSVV